MKRKKVLITGANGVIGTVLQATLLEYDITVADLPHDDLRDYTHVEKIIADHDAIIHLAWDTKSEHATSETTNSENSVMFENVFRAALHAKIPRVIMASSVHAHKLMTSAPKDPLSPFTIPEPNNPYGAHKLFMEALGKYYANQGLEVTALRFGGVTPDNRPIMDERERPLWLSHRDLGILMKACLEKNMPENFAILWATSRGAIPYYDLSNPFGWMPEDTP